MAKLLLNKYFRIVVVFFAINVLMSIISALTLPGKIKFFTNKSYSMSPAVPKNGLSIVVKLPFYDPGDVIVYYALINKKEEIISHRIVRMGGNVYLTKGDNNQAVDPTIVLPRLIIGKVILTIPYLGDYITFIKKPVHELINIYTYFHLSKRRLKKQI